MEFFLAYVGVNYGGWQKALMEESGAGLIIPSNDIEKAATMLGEFLADGVRGPEAGRPDRQLAEEQFDRDLLAQQLEAVLKSAVSRSRETAHGSAAS